MPIPNSTVPQFYPDLSNFLARPQALHFILFFAGLVREISMETIIASGCLYGDAMTSFQEAK